MAVTYDSIASHTLVSNTTSYTFSGISSAYTDLVLVAYAANSVGQGYGLVLRFNSDTGSNYWLSFGYGNGTSVTGGNYNSQSYAFIGTTNASFTEPVSTIAHIQNYASATYKPIIAMTANNNYRTFVCSSAWRSTAAITSITIIDEGFNNLLAGSRFDLYGILKA